MHFVLLAFLISGSAGAAAGIAVAQIAADFRAPTFGRATGVCLGILVTVLLFPRVTNWLVEASTITVIGANPRQAERRFDLPPNTTSDFCYHVSPAGTTLADFYISESDFLAWLRSQKEFESGSYSEIIESPHDIAQYELVRPVRRIDSAEHCLKVRRGYAWFMTYPNRGDHTKAIVYDLDSGRAYFQHNLR